MIKGRITILLLAAMLLISPLLAQTAAAHGGSPAVKFRSQQGKRTSSYFVEYLQYGNEPAFRIRAHHYHAWCNGYLYITPTSVIYDPSLTPNQKDGISVQRRYIQSFTPRLSGYELTVSGKLYKFAFLSDADRPFEPNEQDQRPELMRFIALAYSDFAAAQSQFFATILGQKSLGAEQLRVDAKPAIRILEPDGAVPNGTVDGSAAAQQVLGIATASSGITGVVVNGNRAQVLKPLTKQIVFFETGRFPLTSGANDFTVEATAADSGKESVAFHVTKPEVRIDSPAPSSKTRAEKITIEGTVVGMRDIKRVELANKPVSLTKRDDGSVGFKLADLPLGLGLNRFAGFATSSNGQISTFDVAITRLAPVPPLSLEAIERALKASVSPVRLQALVNDQGVDFELTEEAEKSLRAAGATKPLLDAIADAYIAQAQ